MVKSQAPFLSHRPGIYAWEATAPHRRPVYGAFSASFSHYCVCLPKRKATRNGLKAIGSPLKGAQRLFCRRTPRHKCLGCGKGGGSRIDNVTRSGFDKIDDNGRSKSNAPFLPALFV